MKAVTVFENIESPREFYVVEKTEHTLSINNKPVLKYTYDFFIDENKAKEKKKLLKDTFIYKSPYNKIRLSKIDRNFFKWVEISPRKAITNGVEHNYYYLHGDLNKKHPNTGDNIQIQYEFDVLEGEIISKILNKNNYE